MVQMIYSRLPLIASTPRFFHNDWIQHSTL